MSGNSLERAVFGNPLKLLVVLAGVSLVVVAVFGTATAVGVFGAPDVSLDRSRLHGVNQSTTTVQSQVVVSNPNPIPVPLTTADVTYTVYLNGIPVGEGREPDMTLPAGKSTERVQTTFDNDRLVQWWKTHIRRGERSNLTVVATMNFQRLNTSLTRRVAQRTVRTNVLAAVESNETTPVDASTDLVSNPVLYVNGTTAQWDTVTENRTTVQTSARVFNPKSYAIPVTGVTYDVTMNGIPVATGSTTNLTSLPARSHQTVTSRLVMDSSTLDRWWVSHVRRNQSSRVRVESTVRFRTAFGTRTITPEPVTRTVETDVFGDNASMRVR